MTIPNVRFVFMAYCILSTISLFAQDQNEFVVVEEPLKDFSVIASQSQSNYEKIKTWSGEYEFEERTLQSGMMAQAIGESIGEKLPSEFIFIQKGRFQFKIDIRKNMLFVICRHSDCSLENINGDAITIDEETKNKLDGSYLRYCVTIMTPQEFISFDKTKKLGSYPDMGDRVDKIGRVAFRYHSRKSPQRYTPLFIDPRDFFQFGGRFFWTFCDDVAKKKHPLHIKFATYESRTNLKKASDTEFVKYHISQDFIGTSNSNIIADTDVDSACSFNVTEFVIKPTPENPSHKLEERKICKYKKVENVFIPFQVEEYLIESDTKNVFRFTRHSQLVNVEINQPLSKDSFSVKQLELEDGDRFFDEIKNKLFEVSDGKMNPLKSQKKTNIPSMTTTRIVLIVLGIIFIIVGTLLKIRKRMKKYRR